jgi:nitrite reductase/ring-hydroxylating ferredoxin subunit
MDEEHAPWLSLGSFEDLRQRGCLTGHGIAAFLHEDRVYAVDNRCPHMGFPLSEGTVQRGILTCHWHAWQFDLASGGCLTPAEGDVPVYPTKVEDGQVLVQRTRLPRPLLIARSQERLEHALRTSSTLEGAKAVYRLLREGAPATDLVRSGAELGIRFQRQFSGGLVTLTALARVLRDYGIPFSVEEQVLALVRGLASVATEAQGTAPRRFRTPLPSAAVALPRLAEWFRGFLEDRETFAAERTLRTAFAAGTQPGELCSLVLAGATDHVFLGTGHVLDFCNKAIELLDIIGWDQAPDVLTALLADVAESTRHEEDMTWKHPKDLIGMIADSSGALASCDVHARSAGFDPWDWGDFLTEADPEEGFAFLVARFREGQGLAAVAQGLAAAAVLRMHRFHTRNEFFDWDTLHHLFTHANAFLRLSRRFPSPELARGAFHLYGYLYLCRFLNIPKARLPEQSRDAPAAATPDGLAAAIEARRVDEAALAVHRMLATGISIPSVEKALAAAALREDHGFHTWQQLEAAFSLHQLLAGDWRRRRPLSSLARWLAAHSPTPRSLYQTVDNAVRLERGDSLHEDDA